MRSKRLVFIRPTFCHHKRQENVGEAIEIINIFSRFEKGQNYSKYHYTDYAQNTLCIIRHIV